MLTIVLGVLLLMAGLQLAKLTVDTWQGGYSIIWVAWSGLTALAPLVAGILCLVTAATAQETIDLNPVADGLRGLVVEVLMGLFLVVALWAARKLREKWGIDIEAQVRAIEAAHRGTLHSAVDTWTRAAMAKYGPDLSFAPDSPAMRFILEGVRRSAPDAVKALGAGADWIVNKAAGVAGVDLPPATK